MKPELRWLYLFSLLCMSGLGLSPIVALADDYSDQWGPELGATLPLLEAPDHTGRARGFEDLKGNRGLLLFMNRSTDW